MNGIKSFQDWFLNHAIVEAEQIAGSDPASAQQKSQEVIDNFRKAREELESIIDTKFAELSAKLHKTFGNVSKLDSNTREDISQRLINLARRVKGDGADPVPGKVAECIKNINGLLTEAEEESVNSPRVIQLGSYLKGVKSQIMGQVDAILNALRQDVVNKSLSDIGSTVSHIKSRLESPPLNAEEEESAFHNLANLARNIPGMMERQGMGDRSTSKLNIKIMPGGGKAALAFSPTKASSIKKAISYLEDPRRTRVLIGKEEVVIDLTNKTSVDNLITRIQSPNWRLEATPVNPETIKTANKPRQSIAKFNPQLRRDNPDQ